MFWSEFLNAWVYFCAMLSFWVMVDFVFYSCSDHNVLIGVFVYFFFAMLSFWVMADFVFYSCSDHNVLIGVFVYFFCAMLSFWLMADFVFCCVLDLAKNLIGFITKYAVGANLFRLGSSILKDAGSRGAALVGAKPSTIFFSNFFMSWLDA